MTRKKAVYVVTLSAIAFFVAVNVFVEILRATSGA